MVESKGLVLKGFFWRFAERIAAQLVSFIVSVVLARILLPSEYGTVAIVLLFINIADIFVSSGPSSSLVQNKNADDIDFTCGFYASLILSIVLYACLFYLAPVIAEFYRDNNLILIIRVFSIKLPISAYNSIQHAYVSRHMLFKKFFFSTIIGTVISGMIGISIAVCGGGVWALVAQYIVNAIMDSIVLTITIAWKPCLYFSYERTKPIISYGIKILAADLIGTIYNNLRGLLIGRYYSSAELAYYNKGKQIPELISTNINTSISSVLFPVLSNHNDDKNQVKQMTKKAVRTMSYLSWPFMFGLIASSEPIVILLLSEKWRQAIPLMCILCLSKPLDMITNVNLQVIKAMGKSGTVLKLELFKKPIGFIIILVSIKFGVYWIAWSVVIYDVYATIVNMIPNGKCIGYSVIEQIVDILPFIVMSLIMGMVVNLVNYCNLSYVLKLFIQVPLGVLCYLLMSIVFKIDIFVDLVTMIKKGIHVDDSK